MDLDLDLGPGPTRSVQVGGVAVPQAQVKYLADSQGLLEVVNLTLSATNKALGHVTVMTWRGVRGGYYPGLINVWGRVAL